MKTKDSTDTSRVLRRKKPNESIKTARWRRNNRNGRTKHYMDSTPR